MKEIFKTLDIIEHTGSTNEKQVILIDLFKSNKNAEEFFQLSFNDIIYDVSDRSFEKSIEFTNQVYRDPGELMEIFVKGNNTNYTLNDIKKFLNHMETISGNEKITYLKELLKFDNRYAKWISRLVNKDLRIGMSIKSVNKSLVKANLKKIEKFTVQLCGKFKDVIDYNKGFPVLASIKYDGERAVLSKVGKNVTFTSRQGKNIDYVPELIEHFREFEGDFIYDGEILCNTFNELQKRIGRKLENINPIEGLHFRCFDVIKGYDEHNKVILDFNNLPQLDRTQFLITLKQTEMFKIEKNEICNSELSLSDFYYKAIKNKEEGIIVKLLMNKYAYNSRNNWFKIKPYTENTFEVIGFSYGKGKNAKLISSLDVIDKSGLVKTSVGSGLSDENKEIIMELRKDEKLIGSFIDVEYEYISPMIKGTHSLKFPRFLKFRYDKNSADNLMESDKNSTLDEWM